MDDSLLSRQLRALLAGQTDWLANTANFAAFIFEQMPQLNWVGFYRLRGDELLLGPFQGRPACTCLKRGKGVCWAAAEKGSPLVVPDVHAFPGHIACDSASQSEMVLPLIISGKLWGVLDIDSPVKNRFGADEQDFLQRAVEMLLAHTSF